MPNAKILTINNVDYDLKDENGRLGIASEFSTSSNYAIGDYCWYDNKLYRFTANHSSSTWVAAHATEVKITDELIDLATEDEIAIVKTSNAGKTIIIDDAVPGRFPISLPTGATVYGRNMYKLNAISRTSNGVTFTVSSTDPNEVLVDGTATSNAYSFGSITKSNANMLLEPGTYFFVLFSDKGKAGFYFNVLSDESSSTSTGAVASNALYLLTLTERSYVAARIQIPSGTTCTNETVRFYASKAYPYNYVPYEEPDGLFRDSSVVLCQNASDTVSYYSYRSNDYFFKDVSAATFNCGDYSGDGGYQGYVDVATGDFNAYAQFIGGLNAQILFTQEDRLYWDVPNQITTMNKLYKYLYENGGIVSMSTSNNGVSAKGIYTNYKYGVGGKYTFTVQGTTTDGGSSYFWNSLTYGAINISGIDILLVSVHLSPKEWNSTVRKSQIGEIIDLVNAIGIDHVIIAGDMNVWSDELDVFSNAGYILANDGIFGEFDTYYGSSIHPFDNIIVSPNIKIKGVEAVNADQFKDHYALKATVTIL